MYNENDNRDFLRDKLSNEITLPESLSKENIVSLLSDKKVKKSKKGAIRRFIAVGVAACIMITGVAVFSGHSFGNPEITADQLLNNEAESSAIQESSYDELLGAIKKYAEEYKEENYKVKNYFYIEDGVDAEEDFNAAVSSSTVYSGSVTGTADSIVFGEVNLREENVYEDDIFITDGEYLYGIVSYGKRLMIVKADADGSMTTVYEGEEASLSQNGNGDNIYYSGLYKYENYLIVVYTKYTSDNYYSVKDCSGVMIYDVADRANPVLKKEIAIDGNYVSSRIVDGKLIFISRYSITKYFEEAEEENYIPSVYNGELKENIPCDCIVYYPDDKMECYVNIAKIDLENPDEDFTVSSYLGNVSDTYCTKDTLYVISNKYSYSRGGVVSDVLASIGGTAIMVSDVCTTVTKIDISGEKAEIICKTEFEGSVLNSYSIDEYNGYLRVAVHKDDENCIYVFDEALGKVGEITGIAEGELIKSARFMGDTAYMVTFVQTDPLFVIDLTDPEKPEIAGEVKLPGFSEYLHPVGNGLLVGIGVGGTETGTDGSGKISLFDVTDPASPKEIDSLIFPTSQLGTAPKAYCSVTESSFLVTYENWTINYTYNNTNEELKYYKSCMGALYIGVNEGKLTVNNAYLVKSADSVSRATFIGENVYIFCSGFGGLASFNMNSGEFICNINSENEIYTLTPIETPYEDIIF